MPVLLPLLLRFLTLLTTAYILILSSIHIHRVRPHLSKTLWSVTIISGAATLWTLTSLLTTCAKTPSLLLLTGVGDMVFSGCLAAIAVLLRLNATTNCGNNRDCNLDKAAFAVAVAGAYIPLPPNHILLPLKKKKKHSVLFFLLAILSLRRYNGYRKNRAFGPGPENGYSTAPRKDIGGKGSRRWSGSEQTVETGGFTRHAGYREPTVVTGGFDPKLQPNERAAVYQAF
ncbi:hypothetical protein BDD12DRAFT_848592 [Trichophaea hybrida]|nr:hypothetical protein BDD12DRAFT_848592 [Trichophaea hybrida]